MHHRVCYIGRQGNVRFEREPHTGRKLRKARDRAIDHHTDLCQPGYSVVRRREFDLLPDPRGQCGQRLADRGGIRTPAWALVQISPGINLVKLTALIGYHLRCLPGVLAAVGGLLVPSVLATVFMTAIFAAVHDQPAVHAAMRGIVPATIGLSLAMAISMAQPFLRLAQREGTARLAAHVFVLAGSGLALALLNASPLLVMLLSGLAIVLLHVLIPAAPKAPAKGKSRDVGSDDVQIGAQGEAHEGAHEVGQKGTQWTP